MSDQLPSGLFSTLEKLIAAYGVGTSILSAIGYFVYLTYSKMTSDHQCKELVDALLSRVKELEDHVDNLSDKLQKENDEIADLRVRNRELEIRLSHMEEDHARKIDP